MKCPAPLPGSSVHKCMLLSQELWSINGVHSGGQTKIVKLKKIKKEVSFVIESFFVVTIAGPDGSCGKQMKICVIYDSI
jgi:hypothetical protein